PRPSASARRRRLTATARVWTRLRRGAEGETSASGGLSGLGSASSSGSGPASSSGSGPASSSDSGPASSSGSGPASSSGSATSATGSPTSVSQSLSGSS